MSDEVSFAGLSVGDAQRACVTALKAAGIDEPVLEARLLLGFILGGGPERVLADRDNLLTDEQVDALGTVVQKRRARMPMAHILGVREFWSLNFKVTGATLVPRPDSETLIEAALDHVRKPPRSILDLGTGSGCLLLALLSEWPGAFGTGVDASQEALAVARENAQALGLADRADFVQGDWGLSKWMDDLNGPFDVVISNPPYIPTADIEDLDQEVRGFDPMAALDGGASGLEAYEVLSAALPTLLAPEGSAVFEVGIGQDRDVAGLLSAQGLDVLDVRADLGGVPRAVVARKG